MARKRLGDLLREEAQQPAKDNTSNTGNRNTHDAEQPEQPLQTATKSEGFEGSTEANAAGAGTSTANGQKPVARRRPAATKSKTAPAAAMPSSPDATFQGDASPEVSAVTNDDRVTQLQAALDAAQEREAAHQQTIAALETTIQRLHAELAQAATVQTELTQTQTTLQQAQQALSELDALKQVVRQLTQQNAELEQQLSQRGSQQSQESQRSHQPPAGKLLRQSALPAVAQPSLPTSQPSPRLSNADLGWVD